MIYHLEEAFDTTEVPILLQLLYEGGNNGRCDLLWKSDTAIISRKYAQGDELKWLLKEGGGCIFESCDTQLV